MRNHKTLCFALLASTSLISPRASALDLPSAPSVAHGSVGITTPNAGTMSIQQGSPTAIVNWQSFSVGNGARVDIQQPSSSSTLLNRVTGQTTSTIAGSITANGQVYLVNPNGIVITPTGTVKAGGGFVASTLGTTDEDFIAGRRNFTGNGNSASVTNQGAIEVGRGGYAALIGGAVDNAGTISVSLGKVGLGAGERATLDISGDGFLQVAVPSGSAGEKALIQHSGRITANGGRVEIKAATAREAARQAINLSGVVEARSVRGRSGAIVLGGGESGAVNVSGRLDASATRQARNAQAARSRAAKAAKGGDVTITGDKIKLVGATVDVSGRQGGGSVRIGGDYQGKGDLQRARSVEVDTKSRITADATQSGDGGRVILWSDAFTGFAGLISARGGEESGNGGFAEVSSKGTLSYDGSAILTAAKGSFGTLLLDPYNITISTGTTTGSITTSGGDGTPSGPGATSSSSYVASSNDSILNVTTLQNQLATAHVQVYTGGTDSTSGLQAGNITVAAPISWTSSSTLTLRADGNIAINQAITAPQGGLRISGVDSTASAAISVGTFVLQQGTWSQVGTTLPSFAATDFRVEGASTFLRAVGGTGAATAPYLIADVYGLQGMASTALLAQSFALANDIDATGTASWTDGAGANTGFSTIGNTSESTRFSGNLDGQGHSIRGLYINRPAQTSVGLFGDTAGSIRNVALIDANVTGSNAGVVAGINRGSISHTTASGTVTAATNGGGLVGTNLTGSSIDQSNSHATVTGSATDLGGLAGINDGSITNSYAFGAVNSALVSTSVGIGGLAGTNTGQIGQSYFSGTIAAGTDAIVGGVVGVNSGTLTGLFFDTTRSGRTQGVGSPTGATGVTGLNTADFQNMANFVPLAQRQGWNFETTWAPPSTGFYPELYATSPVIRAIVDNTTRLYGDPNPTVGQGSAIGGPGTFVFGPASDSVSLASAITTTAGPTSPVGTYTYTGGPATSTAGLTYRIVPTTANAAVAPTLSVTPAPLQVAAVGQSKLFGTSFTFTGTELLGTGLRNGETIGSATLTSTGAPASANVGSYPIQISNAVGGTFNPTNYTITYVPGMFEVRPAALTLTLTANDRSKVYGDAVTFTGTEFSSAGLQNGDTVGSVTLTSAGAPATANAGNYPILISQAAGGSFNPANYTINYVPGTLLVTPAPLTVTANNLAKIFGANLVFAGTEFTSSGLRNGETIGTTALTSDGATAAAAVGAYPIRIGTAAGGSFNPANYTIAYVNGTLTVDASPLPPGGILEDDLLRLYNAEAGVPVREMPVTTVSLPNPIDNIDFGGFGGGPTLGTGQTETVASARSTLASVEASARTLEDAVTACGTRFARANVQLEGYTDCVGNALESFASALDARVLTLPGPMRGVSAAIRQAAREVRAARTIQEARVAVGKALTEVRKVIALIRADDPTIGRIQLQQGNRIASALGSVELKLSRAGGL